MGQFASKGALAINKAKQQLQLNDLKYKQWQGGKKMPSYLKKQFAKRQAASAPAAAPAAGGGGGGGGGISGSASASLKAARDLYAPGGAYGKGLEASLARGQKKAVASGTQSLVSSGLASTSMGAGLGKQYEEEIAMPARANMEDRRVQAMAGLHATEAGMQYGSSESAASRAFSGQQAGLDRDLTREQGAAGRATSLAAASAGRPAPTSNLPSISRPRMATGGAPAAPVAGQHVGSASGIGSFLQNLQASDIMKSPSWEF